jgi:threonine aldolase
MVVGSAEAMAKGRLYRKRLGGGMRQAGVLAAAGLIALEEMPKRLGEDHANARLLAEGLSQVPGIGIQMSRVQTNIVIFDVSGTEMTGPAFSDRLKERGVLANSVNDRVMRMVTHYDVSQVECERVLEAVGDFCPR